MITVQKSLMLLIELNNFTETSYSFLITILNSLYNPIIVRNLYLNHKFLY